MEEIRELEGTGVSSLLRFSLTLPPGHVMLGFEDENGVFYSVEQLKAIEWQEKNQMDNQAQKPVTDTLQKLIGEISAPKFRREIEHVFRLGELVVATGNDGTVWLLKKAEFGGSPFYWAKMEDMSLPNLPQGETF